jgi:hypothetical protein
MQGQWQGGKGSGKRKSQISYKEECIRYDLSFRDQPEPVPCKLCGWKPMIIQSDDDLFMANCANLPCEMKVEETSHSLKEATIRWNYENK